MSDIRFSCPYCDGHLVVEDSAVGERLACPHCMETIHVQAVSTLLEHAQSWSHPTSSPPPPPDIDDAQKMLYFLLVLNLFAHFVRLFGARDTPDIIGSIVAILLTPLVILALLHGIRNKRRWAWQWGRLASGFQIFSYISSGFFALLALATHTQPIGRQLNGSVPASPSEGVLLLTLLVSPLGLMAAWPLFNALGTQDSRRHFGLLCPKCGSQKSKSADFLFRKVHCMACEHSWS